MGLEPTKWGPSTWASIHLICLGAPEVFGNEQLSYRKYFESLPYVLPCEKCRSHLLAHLEKHPMDSALSGGRSTLFAWSVELHNIVNRSLGKPEMTVDDALKKWTSFTGNYEVATIPIVSAEQNQSPGNTGYAMRLILIIMIALVCGMLSGMLFVYFYANK